MRPLAAALVLTLLASSAVAQDWSVKFKALKAGVPAEVATYMDRRSGCNHWTGEEPYDAQRRADIEKAIAGLRCVSIDRDETDLRRRYATDPAVLAAMDYAGTF